MSKDKGEFPVDCLEFVEEMETRIPKGVGQGDKPDWITLCAMVRSKHAENAELRERLREFETGHPHWRCQNDGCAALNSCHVGKCTACGTEAPELALFRERAAKVEGLESSLRRMQEERDEARKTVAFLHKASAKMNEHIGRLLLEQADNHREAQRRAESLSHPDVHDSPIAASSAAI